MADKLVQISALTFAAINAEAVKAQVKHKDKTPLSHEMTGAECLAILMEEVGEVAHLFTYDVNNNWRETEDEDAWTLRVEKELIQVAAIAAMWIESLNPHTQGA